MPESADNNQPPTQSGRGLVRLRIDLGYDGTNFKGWAIQPGVRTVQAEVEAAITMALRQSDPLTVVVAGRTDSGVHARGQVVHCDVPDDVELDFYKLVRSLNGLTPEDIRIFRGRIAPDGFDARYSAIARRYTYSIADGDRDPIIRSHTVPNYKRLDVDLMNEAAKKMVGLNDYSAFCKESEFGTSIRNLQQFSWERTEFGVKATLKADAFCHSMVRALVGSMIPVGEGRKDVDFPINVLSGQERHPLAVTMPPNGLVLEEIYYPADDLLAARQLETRSTRMNTESKSDSWD
jgi:tRNA pseudouridine38-40 synthase